MRDDASRELRELLLSRLDYDPEQGAFFRKAGRGLVAGMRIGALDSWGKRQAMFNSKRYQVAHLVWLVETGSLPKGLLRHSNGDPADDRFANLMTSMRTPKDQEAFLSRAREKFVQHDFSQVRYEGAGARVTIICPTHGEFSRMAREYLNSEKGCPACCQEHARRRQTKTPKEKRVTREAAKKRRNERRRTTGSDRERQRQRREADREGQNAYMRAYHRRNKHTGKGKVAKVCRQMIVRVMRQARTGRTGRTEEMHGYTMQEFKRHIEEQFEGWMTWGNHGKWHVDHIVPVWWLIAHGVIDPRIINALDNLRPLKAEDNLQRGRGSYA